MGRPNIIAADRRRIALAAGAIVLAGPLAWLWSVPDRPHAARSVDSIKVVSSAATGRAPVGGGAPPARVVDDRAARATEPVRGGLVGLPQASVPVEPPDPTLYSDDQPWGNAVYAIDGVVQPPRPGRIMPRQEDVPIRLP